MMVFMCEPPQVPKRQSQATMRPRTVSHSGLELPERGMGTGGRRLNRTKFGKHTSFAMLYCSTAREMRMVQATKRALVRATVI
jgi:hypothetical protein